jgi:plastocyanin
MRLFRISLLLAASFVLVGAVAACGDDDDDGGGDEGAATTPAGGGGAANEASVEAKDFSFEPDTVLVTAGEDVTVTLVNTGSAPHTLTVYTDEDYQDAVDGADTGTVNGGESGEFTVSFEGGEYYFRCEVHPSQMQGELEAE